MKKYVIVASPDITADSERMKSLRDKAKGYYGEKEYSVKDYNPSVLKVLKELAKDGDDCNANLFILGVQLVIISQVDSVYFSSDWESSEFCKDVHLLCFKYGIDIRYEPV